MLLALTASFLDSSSPSSSSSLAHSQSESVGSTAPFTISRLYNNFQISKIVNSKQLIPIVTTPILLVKIQIQI